MTAQQLSRKSVRSGKPQQQMLCRDVFILELIGFLLSRAEDGIESGRERQLSSPDLRLCRKMLLQFGSERFHRNPQFPEQRCDEPVLLGKQRNQQMFGFELSALEIFRPLVRRL